MYFSRITTNILIIEKEKAYQGQQGKRKETNNPS